MLGKSKHPSRRTFLAGTLSSAVLSTGGNSFAQSVRGAAALPPRVNVVIRNAYIMTMDSVLGDLVGGDVHFQNGEIIAVAKSLEAPGATVVDGRDMIVMPGFVDTHTHLWIAQMRGRFGDTPETVFFKMRNRLADGYLAQDIYAGTKLGAAESVFAGITSCVDFFHNVRGPDYVDGALRALKETGIRCRLLFGNSTRTPPDQTVDLALLEKLYGSWKTIVDGAPLTLGLAWRGPLGIVTPSVGGQPRPEFGAAKEDFAVARRLGIPISVHISGMTAKGQFASLVQGNFLGADVQLVHFSNASAEDIRTAAQAGSPVALTPLTELRVGYGITQLSDYLAGGMKVGFGIDSNSLAGDANYFTVLKTFQGIEAGRQRNELAVKPRHLLEIATIGSARSIGMDNLIGSITPGKRADIIMIDTRALNLGMIVDDPSRLLVESAHPSNVDTVVIDGRILKRDGKMTALDVLQVVRDANESITNVMERVRS